MNAVQRIILRALGLGDLATALGTLGDQTAGLRRDVDALAGTVQKQTQAIASVSNVAGSANARLTYYERHVVPLRPAVRALTEQWQREARRAEAAAKLATGPSTARPEMSEAVGEEESASA